MLISPYSSWKGMTASTPHHKKSSDPTERKLWKVAGKACSITLFCSSCQSGFQKGLTWHSSKAYSGFNWALLAAQQSTFWNTAATTCESKSSIRNFHIHDVHDIHRSETVKTFTFPVSVRFWIPWETEASKLNECKFIHDSNLRAVKGKIQSVKIG